MTAQPLIEKELTRSAIAAFFDVYNALGFGFLEHVYIRALEIELRGRGHRVGREVGVRIMYKGEELAYQRIDMIVDDKLVIERNRPMSSTRERAVKCTTTSGRQNSRSVSSSISVPKPSSTDPPVAIR